MRDWQRALSSKSDKHEKVVAFGNYRKIYLLGNEDWGIRLLNRGRILFARSFITGENRCCN